jgi:hypothetical protein
MFLETFEFPLLHHAAIADSIYLYGTASPERLANLLDGLEALSQIFVSRDCPDN